MTALEKLNQIRSEIYPRIANETLPARWFSGEPFILRCDLYNKDMDFIFNSFDAMRKLAVRWRNSDCSNQGHRRDGKKIIEKEFEKMMRGST